MNRNENNMQRTMLATTLFLLCCCSASNAAESAESEHARGKREAFEKKMVNILPVIIHGKVIDQEGHAVSEANVRISWHRIPLIPNSKDRHREDWLKTDEKGRFTFSCDRPYRAFAYASKAGYDDQIGGSTGDLIANRTSEKAPVVITLRKKGESTFLIKGDEYDAIRTSSPMSQSNRVDILWARDSGYQSGVRYDDFMVAADFLAASNTWIVTYWTTNGTDGFVLTNELLYTAPADGYQQKVELIGPPWPKYMYLRSRSPSVYSRLEFEHTERNHGRNATFRSSYQAWINPYGDRNLEYDNRLEASWRVVDELNAEAKQAFDVKKLPQKPDIPQRIMAMNEQVAREKEASDRRHNDWLEQQKRQKEGKAE